MKILSTKDNLQVLHEDNHIIVVNKRVGDIVQGDKTGDKPLSEVAKEYIKDKYNKPGEVFLGVVHRLDRPTTGIIVFAKTSQFTETLSLGLNGIKSKYPKDLPTNITTIKNFNSDEKENTNFLTYGSSVKNLYLLLLEDL